MVGVFETVPNPRETLAEIFASPRGGIVVVQVPTRTSISCAEESAHSWFYIGTHLMNFPPRTLAMTLEGAGFRCVELWCGKRPSEELALPRAKSTYVMRRLRRRPLPVYWGRPLSPWR